MFWQADGSSESIAESGCVPGIDGTPALHFLANKNDFIEDWREGASASVVCRGGWVSKYIFEFPQLTGV